MTPPPDAHYVRNLSAVGRDDVGLVGGKAASLGELIRAGFRVPPGFCLTLQAFQETAGRSSSPAEILAAPVPHAISRAIRQALATLGPDAAVAVRSSALAEDLPEASFAGQQDTFLNVVGADAVEEKVRACWASLYTERAVAYRRKHGLDEASAAMGVVIQQMAPAEIAGVLFTADPLSGHRERTVVEATLGLGEALASGLVSADRYHMDRRTGRVVKAEIGDKGVALESALAGGTVRRELPDADRRRRVLDDALLLELANLGRAVEERFGAPQDIEFCISGPDIYLLQARPITSLYPPLEPPLDDDTLHVLFCLGHVQMMTDAIRPLGLSVLRHAIPLGRRADHVCPSPWTHTAGGRLYLDVSEFVRNRGPRKGLGGAITSFDALVGQGFIEVTSRPEFGGGPRVPMPAVLRFYLPKVVAALGWVWLRDPARASATLLASIDRWLAAERAHVDAATGLDERFEFALRALGRVVRFVTPILPLVAAGAVAGRVVRGLARATDAEIAELGRGLQGNVLTEIELQIGDLTDEAARHPKVAEALRGGAVELEALAALAGGLEFIAALRRFLERHGGRGPSELDLTRPRWRDDPRLLLRVAAGSLSLHREERHRTHHRDLAERAAVTSRELVRRARTGPMGWLKARLVSRFIRVHRGLLAVREHPKHAVMQVFDLVRQVTLEAGEDLARSGFLKSPGDIYYLSLEECRAAIAGKLSAEVMGTEIERRRTRHERYTKLTPPRVLTSDNEIPAVQLNLREVSDRMLTGTPASAGIVEGIARVVHDPARETVSAGEILVAPYTDPGWTPLFLNAAALVTEVGGVMSHGSIVARESGIPAVVAVPGATRRIETGWRLRVNGDAGCVEVLSVSPTTVERTA